MWTGTLQHTLSSNVARSAWSFSDSIHAVEESVDGWPAWTSQWSAAILEGISGKSGGLTLVVSSAIELMCVKGEEFTMVYASVKKVVSSSMFRLLHPSTFPSTVLTQRINPHPCPPHQGTPWAINSPVKLRSTRQFLNCSLPVRLQIFYSHRYVLLKSGALS